MSEAVAAQIAVLDTKLDVISEDVKEVKELAAATNGRVRSLERWRERFKGAAIVTGVLGGVASAVATGLIVWAVTGAPGA